MILLKNDILQPNLGEIYSSRNNLNLFGRQGNSEFKRINTWYTEIQTLLDIACLVYYNADWDTSWNISFLCEIDQ